MLRKGGEKGQNVAILPLKLLSGSLSLAMRCDVLFGKGRDQEWDQE
jgi:hypothetical protein